MTTHPQDPVVVGPFAIQGRLGRGAMGAVYLARSPGGRLVAVKVVRDELGGDDAFRARFAREIAAARKVSGAFTAAVVDADPDAERPWLATEYLPGPTLQKAVEQSGPLMPGAVQALAGGLAEALTAIHASGLVHRDLKPSNIVLTDNGPRVIDFGIARALEDSGLTATGLVIGTPGYLSPEQITGGAVGPASDVFALGAVLVFAASGRGPFAAGPLASQLHRIVHEAPQIPPLPGALDEVVRRCLARDPGHRPTPADVLRILGPAVHPQPTKILPGPALTAQLPTKSQEQTAGGESYGASQRQGEARPGLQGGERPEQQGGVRPEQQVGAQPGGVRAGRPQVVGGASFSTSRARSLVLAVVSTLLCLSSVPRDAEFGAAHPVAALVIFLVGLGFLVVAVRSWVLVCRRRVVLQLTPEGMTVRRGYQVATAPWAAVSRLRVGGDTRRPWLVAWVDPSYRLPGRLHHGGRRIYPIGHGASVSKRIRQVDELRAALNWYAPHLHDNTY